MDETRASLDESSDRFKQVYADIEAVVRGIFPTAERVVAYKMPGFKIRIGDEGVKSWRGTIDPNYLQLFLVERKSGITLHLWNPRDYDGLERRRAELSAVGFKVMRGCIQWNRKQAYPVETVRSLLESVKQHLQEPREK